MTAGVYDFETIRTRRSQIASGETATRDYAEKRLIAPFSGDAPLNSKKPIERKFEPFPTKALEHDQ